MAEEMNNGSLGAKATIESGSAVKGAKEYIDSISNMEKATLKLGSTVDDIEKQLRVLENQYQINKNALEQLNSTLVEGSANYAENSSNIEKLNAIQKQLATTINECRVKLDNLKDAHEGVREAQEEATDNIKEGTKELKKAREEADKSAQSFDLMKRALIAIGGVTALKAFEQQVLQVRGEFQQLEIAFETMLRSKQQADALMQQLIKTAVITPFGMSDIANSAKQLLAYGVAADEVNETLVRLGDIAAGLSIPINDLAYLYGTTMVQGRMYTQDLNQFLGRGIPIMEELAKQFGVTKNEVKELVTQGKVGFENVKEAIENLTSEGSKFGGLMEKQSKSITGQISNIEDSIEQMYNEIGKKTEGVISDALTGVSSIIDHWQEIGKVLLVVISTYGAYKAAVLAVAAAHKIAAIWGEVQAFLALAKGIKSAEEAMILLNIATKANPIGLILGVIAAAVTAFIAFRDSTDESTEAIKREREEAEQFNKQIGESAGRAISSYKNLQKEYRACKTAHEKREWIKNSSQKFNELGLSITSVTDAENIFVNNTSVILEAFKKRAEAAAWQSKLEAAYAKRVERQIELENKRDSITAGSKASWPFHTTEGDNEYVNSSGQWVYTEKGAEQARQQFTEANDEVIKEIDSEIDKFANKVSELTTGYKSLLKEGGASPKKTQKELDKEKSEAQKKLDKEKSEAQKIADATSERNKAIQKYRDDVKEQDRQAELDIRQQKIDLMEDGYDKQRQIINSHYDRLTEENAKRERQMLTALADEKVNEWLNSNPKATKAQENAYRQSLNLTRGDLSPEQRATLEAYDKIASEIKEKELDSLYAISQQGMTDYLKQYGTFQEQKLAIATEYAEKIKNVQRSSDTEEQKAWKIKNLNKEKDDMIASVEANAVMAEIDWYQVFGNIGSIMSGALAPLLDKLKAFVGTDNFQKLGADQQKSIVDAMDDLRQQIGTNSDIGWRDLASDLTAYQKSLQEVKTATDEYEALELKYIPLIQDARKKLEQARKSGNQEEVSSIEKQISDYTNILVDGGQKVSDSNKKVTTSGQKLAQSTKAVTQPIDDIHNFLSQTGLSELQGLWDSFNQLKGGIEGLKALNGIKGDEIKEATENLSEDMGDAAGAVGDALASGLSKAGLIGQIIGAVLKILDVLKDGIGTLISSLIDSILGAIEGILDNLLSGKFLEQIGGSLIHGVGSIIDTLTGAIGSVLSFGALSSDGISSWVTNSNAKEVAETTERLTKANEVLSDRISDLTEVMGNSAGARAIYASEKALEAQKEINKNAMDILKAQMSYNSSHHSNAYYADDATIRSYNRSAQEAFAAAGVDASTINGLSSIYNLTPEQLKAIRDFAPDLWKYLTEVGKYDKSEYWEKVVDLAGKTEEITEQINNNLTQTSFDSMRDSFLDALTDMDSTASDFSQKLEDMFFKATVNSMVLGDEFDNWLKDWQARWAEAEKNGNKAVLDDLRIEAENMRENLIEERDRLADDLGYDKNISVSASGKGYTTMSEDTGDALLGMNTAIHIAVEDGNVQREQLLGNSLLQTGYISEIRDIQLESVGLLNGIEKNTRNLIQMAADLAEVKPHLMRL